MVVFATGNLTVNETIPASVDYFFGTSQLLILLISCLLNPVIFTYHFGKREKTSSLLLLLLSLSDFTTLLTTLPSIYNFLRPARDKVTPASASDLTFTVVQLFCFRLSLFITTLMSVQRLVAISKPTYVVKPRVVYVILAGWFIHLALSFLMYMLPIEAFPAIKQAPKYHLSSTEGTYCVWDPMVQSVTCPLGWDEVFNSFLLNLILPALINLTTSTITIAKLLQRSAKVHGRRSVITIVLLSISAGFMYVPAPIVGFLMSDFEQFNAESRTEEELAIGRRSVYEIPMFMVVTFLPQITSVLNPVILIVRGSQLQEYVRHLVFVRLLRRENFRDQGRKTKCVNLTASVSRGSPPQTQAVALREIASPEHLQVPR